MRKVGIVVIVLLIVLGIGAYLGRHTVKTLFMGSSTPTAAPVTSVTAVPTSTASASNIYTTRTDPAKGAYLADFQGMTLYTFDKDTNGVSNCNNGCAKVWPPYTSGATAQSTFPANITVITRTDEASSLPGRACHCITMPLTQSQETY